MSFLPPDLLPGEPYLLGMVTSAGPTQPFFAPASGGGGGGGGPNPSVSSLSFAQGGQINMSTFLSIQDQTNGRSFDYAVGLSLSTVVPVAAQPCCYFDIASPNGTGSVALATANDGTSWLTTYYQGQGASTLNVVADNVYMSSLTVSSINGASPGGGGSAFTSSFLLTIPGGTSSLVMALPAGQYAYMGTALYTGSNNFISGTASALLNVTSGLWSANTIENPNTGNRPADTGSGCSMILNTWENPLSTAKLYINNVNASPAGDATWLGVVGKLY